MTDEALSSLKGLILDDDFARLQDLSSEEINLMDILRVSHKELQHSNFLAWLFNPTQNHGLQDYALKEFIKLYYKENQFQDLGNESGLSVFKFIHMDFSDLEIKREYKNIDLVFISKQSDLCIVIENKVYATESAGQLERYRKIIEESYPEFKHKIYIFLSLEDQEISEGAQKYYTQLTYTHIMKLIEQILSNKNLVVASSTKFIFEQYLRTLKSMLNQNPEIEEIARTLYRKYKAAFDLVYKYTDDKKGMIGKHILDLIRGEESIRPYHSNKSYIRFQPNYLYENRSKLELSGLIDAGDNLQENGLFLFEFKIRKSKVIFTFKIGVGAAAHRQKLYEICLKDTKLFNKVSKKNQQLSPQWHQAYQVDIVKKEEMEQFEEDGDIGKLHRSIEERFRSLMNKGVRDILEHIDQNIG